MNRTALRIAGAVILALVVTACDKCGNININVPGGGGAPKACTPSSPQG